YVVKGVWLLSLNDGTCPIEMFLHDLTAQPGSVHEATVPTPGPPRRPPRRQRHRREAPCAHPEFDVRSLHLRPPVRLEGRAKSPPQPIPRGRVPAREPPSSAAPRRQTAFRRHRSAPPRARSQPELARPAAPP